MRRIPASLITRTVAELCVKANLILRRDVRAQLKAACLKETNKRAKKILNAIITNASIAGRQKLAICQDTGMPCVFVQIGKDARIGGDLKAAINKGIEQGYRKGNLRSSVIKDPLLRGRPGYSPAVIHIDLVKGSRLNLTVLPKGFGCENKAQLKMFNPTVKSAEIKKFIIKAVKDAGPDACPPYVVGVGIGGTADYAMYLANKALLRKLSASRFIGIPTLSGKRYPLNAKLESDLLREINKLNIGPMGLGGKTTALAVNIETYPTHIAGLPVAVNISCHALRSAKAVL